MPISLSGLDMPWLGKVPLPPKPKRNAAPRAKRSHLPAPYVMGDIAPFVSPVGERPEVISSRSILRAHERSNGVYQVGNDINPIKKGIAKKKALEEAGKGVTVEWVA